jgi:hypothetical protein
MKTLNLMFTCIFAALIASCGGNQILVESNFQNKIYNDTTIKKASIYFQNIIDNRTPQENISNNRRFIGFNGIEHNNDLTPIFLPNNLSSTMQSTLNDLASNNSINSTQATIEIDSFYINDTENGFHGLTTNLVLSYKSEDGKKTVYKSTFKKPFLSEFDIKRKYEDIFYESMRDIAREFCNFKNNNIKSESALVIMDNNYFPKNKIGSFESEKSKSRKPLNESIAKIKYRNGDKLVFGLDFEYGIELKPEYSMISHDIVISYSNYSCGSSYNNTNADLIGVAYNPKFYFNNIRELFFLGLGGKFSFGFSKRSNYDDEMPHFVYGPTVDASLGIKLDKLVLETGGYFLWLLKSVELERDGGFFIGISYNISLF